MRICGICHQQLGGDEQHLCLLPSGHSTYRGLLAPPLRNIVDPRTSDLVEHVIHSGASCGRRISWPFFQFISQAFTWTPARGFNFTVRHYIRGACRCLPLVHSSLHLMSLWPQTHEAGQLSYLSSSSSSSSLPLLLLLLHVSNPTSC